QRSGGSVRSEQLRGDIGAFQKKKQPVSKIVWIAGAHGRSHGPQAAAQFFLVFFTDTPGRVVGLRIFHRSIGHAAPTIARLLRTTRHAFQEMQNLRARIAGKSLYGFLEVLPEVMVVLAQVSRRQFVLRGKGTVQAGLGDARLPDHLVDADGPYALLVEEIPCCRQNPVGGTVGRMSGPDGRFNFIVGSHGWIRLTMLPIGTYRSTLQSATYRSVT